MQGPETIASSGGWNVRSVCCDSGLAKVGECWDLADGGWLQVALPDGVKFSYQRTSVRTLEAPRTKSLSPLSHEAEAWHSSSPGSKIFVKQFANASALGHLEKICPSHQNHEKHLQTLTFGR